MTRPSSKYKNELVLIGGGSLAIEALSFINDINLYAGYFNLTDLFEESEFIKLISKFFTHNFTSHN